MDVSSKVTIGLLGTGRIGRVHAELLAHRVEAARLVVVHDVAGELAAQTGATLGVEVAASEDEILGADIDAVAICASTDTHADLVVRAAAAGKHVFCEKPVSLDLADVDRALAAVEAAGVELQVGFNRRFDPSHGAVRDRVAAGDVGTPRFVRITSRDPAPPDLAYVERSGGLFLDMTIHDFDMARFVLGQEVVEVIAAGAVLVEEGIGAAGDVDTAAITLRYESGALGVIDNCREAPYGYDQRVEVLGSTGLVRSDNPRGNGSVLETAAGGLQAPLGTFFLERYLESYVAQWRSFVEAVRTGRPTEVGGLDARAPIVLGLAAQRSLAERRPVGVDEVSGVPA
jgi:myo-inositol 2-dehydrogenase/D-chiro-inositol 1-dehydrogenase